jgi:hypothetical protein
MSNMADADVVPQTFLQRMSLRTGAEIITFLQVINKVSGLYGLLAIITGARIDGWQLSMYLYSTFALLATVFLYKHIRLQSPFQMLFLAHLYAIDSVVNALYTALFGVAWFYTLASQSGDSKVPGSHGISDNAGFTSPKYNVSKVDVIAAPTQGLQGGQNAVAVGHGTGNAGAGLPERQHHEHHPHLCLLGAPRLLCLRHAGLCPPVPAPAHRRQRLVRSMVQLEQHADDCERPGREPLHRGQRGGRWLEGKARTGDAERCAQVLARYR